MRLFFSWAFSFIVFCFAPSAFAHAGHSSVLEIEEVQQTKGSTLLEVTWEVERKDLELQLAMQSDQHVVFAADNSFHDLLLQWLQQNFRLQQGAAPVAFQEMTTGVASSGQKFRFSLLGKELGAKRMLIFFSVKIEQSTAGLSTTELSATGAKRKTNNENTNRLWLQVPALLFLDENYVHLVNARACSAKNIQKVSLRFDREHLEPQALPFCS